MEEKGDVSEDGQIKSINTAVLQAELQELKKEIDLRFDASFCQALGALTTAIVQRIIILFHRQNACVLRQYYDVGILVHFESLLSTMGGELGMVGDMDVSVRMLSRIVVKIEERPVAKATVKMSLYKPKESEKTVPDVETEFRTSILKTGTFEPSPFYLLSIYLPVNLYSNLRGEVREGEEGLIHVIPVLFSQGINEQQSKAIVLKQTELQERINLDSLKWLHFYFSSLGDWLRERRANSLEDNIGNWEHHLKELLHVAEVIESSHREKNSQILSRTADLARKVNGLRLTSCKSAKDRTSMSITWEMARILYENHSLPSSEIQNVAHALRLEGLRLENAWKNTGKKKFAFNSIQRSLIPEEYRAKPEVCV
eukprot:CAMPEP_0201484656 /NCGR_PEP_ID=MMETSP0151_2-20130828/8824_1 /ASSEMBLY_ACC=CAM_ASM_000257 /TAXON_ID=200890 /ORGANISM="Paramoeba atlantica, Strain 621/1 / CCAP 1560/9" /LENGTH=369 /DNA_ID=CAMNT_0047868429 /DNA_START=268 /DNA_END=1377 /DNA_ORIENTATION=+